MTRGLHDLVAELLEYPTPGLVRAAELARRALAPRCSRAAEAVEAFEAFAAGSDPRDLEELYTRTFDLRAPCCLDVGYQLFGENYSRGSFLVRMKREARERGIDPGSELPDHLPVALRVLGTLGPEDDPRGLVAEALLPAIEKMVASFGGGESPYRALLDAVADWLAEEFAIDRCPALRARTHLPLATGEGATP
jgi:nitrate reductase delta subunit